MTPQAAPEISVMLWHPTRGAYLAASGKGFTRKARRAAVMSVGQAQSFLRAAKHGPVQPEPTFAPQNFTPRPPRAELADIDDTELLRRLVLGLRGGDHPRRPRWCVVMDTLGLTSAAAVRLCRRLNIDPMERTGH